MRSERLEMDEKVGNETLVSRAGERETRGSFVEGKEIVWFSCSLLEGVFVVDSSSADPTQDMISLHEHVLRTPHMFEDGYMDHQFARMHVLLHDAHASREQLKYVSSVVSSLPTCFCH